LERAYSAIDMCRPALAAALLKLATTNTQSDAPPRQAACAKEGMPMSRISPANPTSGHVADELSHARLERLLHGGRDAALLGHRLAMLNIEAKHRLAQYHSHFNPNQPRVPAGHRDGGQWTTVGTSPVLSDVTPDNEWKPGAQYANNSRGGRGSGPTRIGSGQWTELEPGQAARLTLAEARAQDAIRRVQELDPNWRVQLGTYKTAEGEIRALEAEAERAEARIRDLTRVELPPNIPKERPPTARERNDAAREIGRWLAKNLGRIIEGAAWLDEFEESIRAYLDPPKTLKELQEGASIPKKGYDIHHIVEQTRAERDKFPRSMINDPENRVRIPRYKHWEINGWYGRSNEAFGNQSPRDYLRGKDWDERVRIGMQALIKYGVLKP
jgi:hypothetical protein